MVFVNVFSDLYHDSILMDVILEHFRVFSAVPYCTFQILSKRAHRLAKVDKAVRAEFGVWPANVWQGVSVCTAAKVEMQRIEALGQTQAMIKWISFEPWISDPAQALSVACPGLADTLK
jgi:protein gp37